MDCRLEVVILDVSDVDASLKFYTERIGFRLDVDYQPTSDFRVVQLTPPGSACSIQFGIGISDVPRGGPHVNYLVVHDLDGACRELAERGVRVRDVRHKSPVEAWEGGWAPGVDPNHRDYASFADFSDPDGNVWVLQELGHHSDAAASTLDRGADQGRV